MFKNGYKNFNNRLKIILSGICASTSQQKSIEIQGQEKRSFERFLGGQQSKIVELDKVLGIGGEGVVIEKELEITLMEGTMKPIVYVQKAENIRLKSKEKKIVALKFVKFEKDDGKNFEGQGFIIQRTKFCHNLKYS